MSLLSTPHSYPDSGRFGRPWRHRSQGIRVPSQRVPLDDLLGGEEDRAAGEPPSPMLLPLVPDRSAVAQPRISVVIPTYNEAKNLPHVMSALPPGLHEVILVDGHSVDGTVEVARSLRSDVRVIMQNRRGKGNAMACGFAAVTGDVVVMLDADGSADPDEIATFVAALTDGADFAKGSRFLAGGGSDDITAVRAWGNRLLNRLANLLFGTDYTDLCYGYNAFWRHCLDALDLDPRPDVVSGTVWGDGFEIETIINTRMAKAGMRISEVPSFECPRIYGESNLNTWRDGLRVLRALVVERFNGKARNPRPQGPDGRRTVLVTSNVVDDAPLASPVELEAGTASA